MEKYPGKVKDRQEKNEAITIKKRIKKDFLLFIFAIFDKSCLNYSKEEYIGAAKSAINSVGKVRQN